MCSYCYEAPALYAHTVFARCGVCARPQEFHKQALVDALLKLGGGQEVDAAQDKADKMIEVYCDQGFA